MKNNFAIIICMALSAALFTGCRAYRPLPSTVIVHDTLLVTDTVTIRDTVILAPADSISTTVLVSALNKDTTFSKKSRQATVKGTVKDGKLTVDCECDTLALKAQLYDRIRKELRSTSKDTIQPPVTIKEKYVPWYTTALAWIGGVFLAGLSVYLVYKRIRNNAR